MEKIRLGRTGLLVTKTAFGALPIQRISKADAVKLVRRAYEAGINYFDTANMYTDSEGKLGEALHDVRQNVVISTKSGGGDKRRSRPTLSRASAACGRITSTCSSSTIRRCCRISMTRTGPLPPHWRPSRRATSATSASPIIG